ncbi:Phenylalanine--tRNA ligase alpha subunit A [Toxocara canis]|uniref:phenylalanine--tRNA ligase n=1 Tax=Toxocara canis TaxID=6265 RepID=A0A0B2V246_TOXCA|nr:Phenylalanine--tRNA ligase alpha subunit A [Toxocara canis]
MDESELADLNKHFAEFSYIDGYTLSPSDFTTHDKVIACQSRVDRYVHLKRWFNHITSFSSGERDCLLKGGGIAQTRSDCHRMVDKKMTGSSSCEAGGDMDLPQLLLNRLDTDGPFDTLQLAAQLGVDHQKLILTEDRSLKRVELSEEGKVMAENGSHEANVFRLVGENGIEQAEVMKQPFGKIGLSKALAAGWVTVDKSGGSVRLMRKVASIEDVVQKQLKSVAEGKECEIPPKALQDIKKRKLIMEVNVKSYFVKKGPSFATVIDKPELDLTPEMITSYVESSFWNFDALFQPQQHPARDAHDTFFVSDPALSFQFPEDYLERVKTVHAKGGYGSRGYNYDWKIEEAQKNVLRTHTTAVSARQLYKLAQEGFKPTKMFSIDRVFRNETLDATHLAEFHQVEGVIAERDLSLAHVMGLFTEFFRKCGITNLRFKPTYNPYTEPSMEIFAYHEGLKKWVEIGNSGMFRPEMLLPMGLPPDVNVAGYGLSLERPTMIRYGIDNIRDLFGPKVNLEMIYQNPLCRLDKS